MNKQESRTGYKKIAAMTGAGLLCLALLCGLSIAGFIYFGVYNVSALDQHTNVVFQLADKVRIFSVARRSEKIDVPALDRPQWIREGMALYLEHCQLCHGAPGVSPGQFALGMQPLPTSIVGIARKRQEKPEEIFWVIENGVKMTGMPAWKYRLSEVQIWQLVSFIKQLPYLTAERYRELTEQVDDEVTETVLSDTLTTTNRNESIRQPEKGREAIRQYGCAACHRIPGITSAVNDVGPPLRNFRERAFIAGVLENTRENMVLWLQSPQKYSPETTMPDLGLSGEDALSIALYLENL